MEERTLYVGMDIRENKIQLCAYPPQGKEIQIILEDFPLAIGIEEKKKEWQFGREALETGQKEGAILITDFLERLCEGREIQIYGVEFQPELLLSKILKKALLSLKQEFPNDFIKKITLSLENPVKEVTQRLERAFLKLGIDKDRLRIESHGKSFLYYALSRKRELWTGGIVLLDKTKEELLFRRISLDKRKLPMIAGVIKEVLAGEEEELFEWIKPEITTLYLTGSQFNQEEARPLVQKLCQGRRGFLGESVYCQGACVSGRQEDEPEIMERFLMLEEESIQCDISIPVYHNAKSCQAILASASEVWQEAGKSACLILDEEEEIPIKVTRVLTGEEKVHIIALEGLWKRQPRMTKVLIKISFMDKKTCIITVKDLGFGQFCPSSQRIWEKTITV